MRLRSRHTRLKILFIKRDKLGDLLLTTPVLEHVRATLPQAELHLLANDYNAWVAEDHPALARTWIYARVRHAGRLRLGAALRQPVLAWRLRRERFDWAIVAGGDESPRAIRRAIATGATRIVAYAADAARYGRHLTDPLPVPGESDGHELARMYAELAPLGVAPPTRPLWPRYTLPETGHAFARAWLVEHGLADHAYVVLGLGARRARKQPTAAQIVRWTSSWKRAWNLDTVFMWTPGKADSRLYPGDDDIAAPVLARNLPHLHPFRGPIPHALGLIWHARTSIIPDSGLMHFAAASPGGVVGLFAAPHESAPAARWAPLGPRARHLEAEREVAELDDQVVLATMEPLVTSPARDTDSAPDRCTS